MCRRIVSNYKTGEWYVETPKRLWEGQLKGYEENPEKYPAPMPVGHRMFDHPEEYNCYYITSI
jgi:hypothetical protein